MSSRLYVYIPTDGVVKDDNTPTTSIVIKPKDVAFFDFIHVKNENKGFEAFIQFLKSRPLRYALTNIANLFLPKHICEFYFTCTYDDQDDFI